MQEQGCPEARYVLPHHQNIDAQPAMPDYGRTGSLGGLAGDNLSGQAGQQDVLLPLGGDPDDGDADLAPRKNGHDLNPKWLPGSPDWCLLAVSVFMTITMLFGSATLLTAFTKVQQVRLDRPPAKTPALFQALLRRLDAQRRLGL
jgi:hypothetical protein